MASDRQHCLPKAISDSDTSAMEQCDQLGLNGNKEIKWYTEAQRAGHPYPHPLQCTEFHSVPSHWPFSLGVIQLGHAAEFTEILR